MQPHSPKLSKRQYANLINMSEESHSGSETDENGSSDEQANEDNNGGTERISDYEKQRLRRIRENKARLEALKLPSLATKLYGSVAKKVEKKKGKQKKGEEDEEYKPGYGEGRMSSSGEGNEDDEDQSSDGSAYSARRKGKMKQSLTMSKGKKKMSAAKHMRTVEYIDDDEALQQAIALSLGGSSEIPGALLPEPSQNHRMNASALELKERKGRSMVVETDKRTKRRKANTSRVQITEDQVVIHFFQFDDMSRGNNGWQHDTIEGSGTQKSKCKYCGEIIVGACMTRLMQHLAGSSSRGAACEHVPSHVQEEMRNHLYEMQISGSNETVKSIRQSQAVQPQVEEEDPEVRLQKDIEEAMRQSLNEQEKMRNHSFEKQISVSNETVRRVHQPQTVQPVEEEEDPEVRLQKDIEEAMRRSMHAPEYKEMEEIKIAMLESQKLNPHVLGGSSSKTPQSMAIIEDSDEELDRILGFDDNSNGDDDDILDF